MDKEVNTLIELKYGTLSTSAEYIKELPTPVSKRLNNGWPFITVDEVRAALIAYELGEEIPNGRDKVKEAHIAMGLRYVR